MGADQFNPPPTIQRLVSWKAIAAYFGCNERTVKRWEQERDLPVHRVPGGKRSQVYAITFELEKWLRSGTEVECSRLAPEGQDANLMLVSESSEGSASRSENSLAPSIWVDSLSRPPGLDIPATAIPESANLLEAHATGERKGFLHATNLRDSYFRTLLTVAALLILGVIVTAMLLSNRRASDEDPPEAAQLDGSTLRIIDSKGKLLWSKGFADGFDGVYYQQGISTRVAFTDLDGSGQTDVLLLYQPAVDSEGHATTLICYSPKGMERWRWTPGRVLSEQYTEPAVYISAGLAVLKPGNGRAARIVVASNHVPYYPAQVALIDTNGKTISEYWHSGHLDFMALADLDGDGRQEIVLSGVSNGYHQATLVVLDPERVSGASLEVARPEIQIRGMGIAQERLRLLFPRSDLNLETSPYNAGRKIVVGQGTIRVAVLECNINPNCLVWYDFDPEFRLKSAQVDDEFREAHRQYFRRSNKPHAFTSDEEMQLQKIRCLAGCRSPFVELQVN